MIDHVRLNVRNLDVSRRFYAAALVPLGYEALMSFPEAVGFGASRKPDFWIAKREPVQTGVHVAFACDARRVVDEFHRAALKAGGRDNGQPGVRPQYHPGYYGAFVLDPDGNNVEAVCHGPA